MSASPEAPAPREEPTGDVSGMRPPGRWSVDHWPDRDCPWRVLRHEDSCDVYVDDYEFLYEAEARAVCDALNGLVSRGSPTPAMIAAAAQALYDVERSPYMLPAARVQDAEDYAGRLIVAEEVLRAALTAQEGTA